jgi:hypothetical protein
MTTKIQHEVRSSPKDNYEKYMRHLMDDLEVGARVAEDHEEQEGGIRTTH